MTPLWLQVATLVVLALTLAAAIWYAWETRKVWKASLDQAEALLKPCITLNTSPRDFTDANFEAGGIRGETVLRFREGFVIMMNIGNGPALHVYYGVEPVNPPPGKNAVRHHGYLHVIQAKAEPSLPVPRGVLQLDEFEFTITYQSLSRRHYKTRIRVHDLVLTEFGFDPVNKP